MQNICCSFSLDRTVSSSSSHMSSMVCNFGISLGCIVFSLIFIWLTLKGNSHYPKWIGFLNPTLLIGLSFAIYLTVPVIGKFLMPIALNVAFGIFFIVSLMIAKKKGL